MVIDNGLLQIPSELAKIETMAHKSLKLVFNTQENLTDEQCAKIMANYERLGYLVFLVGESKINPEDILDLPEIKDESVKKSQSERLRAVLYLWHTKRGGKDQDFPVFYNTQMERLIGLVKEKLD